MSPTVTIIGAGLAGSECALQIAHRGIAVNLIEMRPLVMTPAHTTGNFAELVCSNSLRSEDPLTAVGLLKQELRRLGSHLVRIAEQTKVPAGMSLAVSRAEFSAAVTAAVTNHPLISVERREISELPTPPLVIASGPLTSPGLCRELENRFRFYGMHYYDATSPIIAADSIDLTKAFCGSRYEKGDPDFLNCPMNRETYQAIVAMMREAPTFLKHEFDDARFFEGCLPVEVMAKRGIDTLKFGPWKPVGLTEDPAIEAVVQLRKDDLYGTTYNIVGFQTQLLHGEQKKIINLIPGLEHAEILRYGNLHKNVYVNSPRWLDRRFAVKDHPGYWLSGQLTGVEGYTESIASGLSTSLGVYAELNGPAPGPAGLPWSGFPAETMIGALGIFIEQGLGESVFQPSNIQFGLVPPLAGKCRKKEKRQKYRDRAETALAGCLAVHPWLAAKISS